MLQRKFYRGARRVFRRMDTAQGPKARNTASFDVVYGFIGFRVNCQPQMPVHVFIQNQSKAMLNSLYTLKQTCSP